MWKTGGMTAPTGVDDYMATLPERSRAALETLRATIRAAAPEATEAISYAMPAFRSHGRVLVYYAAFKGHCSLFPASGAVIAAYVEELKGYHTSRGTIQFPLGQPLPTALVESIVRARLEENAARSRR